MSIKIYNGKKMHLVNIVDFNNFINELRVKSNIEVDNYIKSLFLNKMLNAIDKYFIFKFEKIDFKEWVGCIKSEFSFEKEDVINFTKHNNDYKSIRDLILMHIMKLPEKLDASSYRNVNFDIYFKVNFFIMKDKILMIPYFEQDFFNKILSNHHYVDDYAYQDSRDDTGGIDEIDYEKRGSDWKEALSGDAFSIKGIEVDIVKYERLYSNFVDMSYSRMSNLNIIEHYNYEKRMFRLAKDRIVARRIKERAKKYEDEGKEVRPSDFMGVYLDFAEEFKKSYSDMEKLEENNLTNEMSELISYFKSIIPDININSYIKMKIKPY